MLGENEYLRQQNNDRWWLVLEISSSGNNASTCPRPIKIYICEEPYGLYVAVAFSRTDYTVYILTFIYF